jgi:hypothetical protein
MVKKAAEDRKRGLDAIISKADKPKTIEELNAKKKSIDEELEK